MAEFTLIRRTVERLSVPLDRLLTEFHVYHEVMDYAPDVWLQEQGLLAKSAPLQSASEDALLAWLLQRRQARGGGDNVRKTEFEEFRHEIALTDAERREAVAKVREWSAARDA